MKIDDERAKNVCKAGKGKDCCRYLTFGSDGWTCAKTTPMKGIIDSRVDAGMSNAQSDNCEGLDNK